MQATHQKLQQQLWSKLQVVYDKYVDKSGGQIATSKVQQIVYEALGEQSQQQIDYVIKNMFRLDQDQNGSVSFQQFANFLFKRHCGQMSLQKMHLKGLMSHGNQRKLTKEQFNTLMNNAYKFLGVGCPKPITDSIFEQTDTDKDSLITYVEYFQIIDKYICRKVMPKPKPHVVEGPERFSKLRILLWGNLRILYEAYVSGRHLKATDDELRGLILAIVGELSATQLTFILTSLFKLDFKTIQFYSFASSFLYIIAQLGLSRFSQNTTTSKKTLNKLEFVVLFKNTYRFLRISKIKNQFLWLHFAKIDKNNDGLITFDEYLDWIRRFIAVAKYFGDYFYVLEDDEGSEYDINQVEPPIRVQPNKRTLIQFKFSDLSLAYKVRSTCYHLLEKYDANKDKLFDQTQIHTALTQLLKEDQYELAYVTKNVFRYDRDGDKNVTYDQLTNFSVEQHFGQMAIQRLHKKNSYSKGRERIMNEAQFSKTLIYALAFIDVLPSDQILKLLFSEIDLDNDGWISYEVYFLFLRYYFGSMSQAAKENKEPEPKKLTKDQQYLISLKDLSAIDRFVRILLDQLKNLCLEYDFNKNLVFQSDQIEAILINVFKLSENQVSYVIFQYFRFSSRKQQFVTFEQMIAIILEIYFVEILFRRKYNTQKSEIWKTMRISLSEFTILVWDACFFIRVRPPKQDLKTIFQILDTNKDGFISFEQYISFIRKYLGKGYVIIDQPKKEKKQQAKPAGISAQELAFIEALWGELKKYFDKYDKGSKAFLNDDELKAFAIEVLRQTSKRQLEYIFWNLFRVDSNLNRQVQFSQFAPFILSHAAEISLQRFHRQQTKGKNSLSQEELFIVFKNAYSFLSTMPKSKNVVDIIYKRISVNGTVSYGNFLNWVVNALSRRFK